MPKIPIVDEMPTNPPVSVRYPLRSHGAQRLGASSGSKSSGPGMGDDCAEALLGEELRGEAGRRGNSPVTFLTTIHPNEMNPFKGYRAGPLDYTIEPVNEVIPPSEIQVSTEPHAAQARLQRALNELAERNLQLTQEIAERKRMEAVMRHQAMHDPLTGLPNRSLFGDRLSGAIQRADRHQNLFAMAYIDIDGFKTVNDNHGHAAGDALLQEIAGRLSVQLRSNDTVARLGGDEFALILEEIESPQAALKLCRKLNLALAEPYELRVNEAMVQIRIGASIGIAPYWPSERINADERLMHAADGAMYEAKRRGKNRCELAAEPVNQSDGAAVAPSLAARQSPHQPVARILPGPSLS